MQPITFIEWLTHRNEYQIWNTNTSWQFSNIDICMFLTFTEINAETAEIKVWTGALWSQSNLLYCMMTILEHKSWQILPDLSFCYRWLLGYWKVGAASNMCMSSLIISYSRQRLRRTNQTAGWGCKYVISKIYPNLILLKPNERFLRLQGVGSRGWQAM